MIGCDDTKLIKEEKKNKENLDKLIDKIIERHKKNPEKYLKV